MRQLTYTLGLLGVGGVLALALFLALADYEQQVGFAAVVSRPTLALPTLSVLAVVPVTNTPTATFTPFPSATPSPLPLATPVHTPTAAAPTATPVRVNGLEVASFIIISERTRHHIQEIFAEGQARGRNPHAFSKLGDSTIETEHFLSGFDTGSYQLGDYAYLQPVIDFYAGSFARESAAVRLGFHSWTIFDPFWADKAQCLPNETPIDCELRVQNPSIIIIRLGANDVGVPDSFEKNMRELVAYCLEEGVIPILGTKADRNEGFGNINNDILRQIAADYAVPLWEYDLVAGTLPGRGLEQDGVHMTAYYSSDYTDSTAFQRGHGMHNLTALMALEEVWRNVLMPPAADS